MANPVEQSQPKSEQLGVVLLNTAVPLFVAVVSYGVHLSKIDTFVTRMREAINHTEMAKILRIVPQPLFLFDETNEEVLYQSEAMVACFGQPVKDIFPERIFELTDPVLQGDTVVMEKKTLLGDEENAMASNRTFDKQIDTQR